jgi:two-component system sensor histidine kinase/response regulator
MARERKQGASGNKEASSQSSSGVTARSERRSVLLAEDNAVNQKLAVRILEKMGHRVTVANNGAEACKLIGETRFDVVLMDLQMPVMGGLEATTRIREMELQRGWHTPILAMTAHAGVHDEKRCLEAGMDGYLTKPIRREQLLKEVARMTSREEGKDQPAETKNAGEAPVWDLQELLGRVENDREILHELLVAFRQESRNNLQGARSALEKGSLNEVTRLAHTLKGMLKNLAMHRAAGAAYGLELASRQKNRKKAGKLLAQLERAINEVLEQVSVHLAEVGV